MQQSNKTIDRLVGRGLISENCNTGYCRHCDRRGFFERVKKLTAQGV